MPSPEKDLRREMSEYTDAFNCVRDQVKKEHHQCDVLVDDLEQLIEDDRQGYITRAIKDFDHKAQPIKQFVRLDVLRCSRGIPVDDEPAANEDLRENAPDDDDQVQPTGDSGVELRPSVCDPIRLCTCAHSEISFLLQKWH